MTFLTSYTLGLITGVLICLYVDRRSNEPIPATRCAFGEIVDTTRGIIGVYCLEKPLNSKEK